MAARKKKAASKKAGAKKAPSKATARRRAKTVDAAEVRRRVRWLIDREEDPVDGLSIEFRRRLIDRTVRVILEQPDRSDPGCMTGRCDHYALVKVPTTQPRGRLVNVTITRVSPDGTEATLAPAAVPLPLL